jgi:hypothetical protein
VTGVAAPPLQIRATLRRGLGSYRRTWRGLVPAGAGLYLALGVLVYVVGEALHRPLAAHLTPSLATGAAGIAAALLLYLVLVLFASSVFGTVLMGVVSRAELERPASRARVLGELVYTGLVLGVCFAALLGLGALGLPGGAAFAVLATFAGVRWAVAAPVVVFEQRRGIAALRRSSQLVRGSFWRMLVLFGIAAAAADTVALVLAVPMSVVLSAAPAAVRETLPFALYGVTLPYAYLCVVDAYQQLASAASE